MLRSEQIVAEIGEFPVIRFRPEAFKAGVEQAINYNISRFSLSGRK